MKITGYFIKNSGKKLAYAQFDLMQYQMSNSKEIKYAAQLNSYADYKIIDCENSNSKYIEILNKYLIWELNNNDIISLVIAKTSDPIIPNFLSDTEVQPN